MDAAYFSKRKGVNVNNPIVSAVDNFDFANTAQTNPFWANLVTLGIDYVRTDFTWDYLTVNSSTWNVSTLALFDTFVNQAANNNISVLGMIGYSASWEQPSGFPYPPANNSNYATYAANLVNRYAPMGVTAWEIWNEPNINTFWTNSSVGASPSSYTALIKAAYPAIKAVNSNAIVIHAGLAPASTGANNYAKDDWLNNCYSNGIATYFDAMADHPYTYPNMPDDSGTNGYWFTTMLPTLHTIMNTNGEGAKDIWITEYGAPTGGGGVLGTDYVSESSQAAELFLAFQMQSTNATYSFLGPMFIYIWDDTSDVPNTNPEAHYGIVRPDGTPKCSYDIVMRAPNTSFTQIFLLSGTSYTKPANWTDAGHFIDIISPGGGGGAGSNSTTGSAGAGGGGGAYVKLQYSSGTTGANFSYSIGVGCTSTSTRTFSSWENTTNTNSYVVYSGTAGGAGGVSTTAGAAGYANSSTCPTGSPTPVTYTLSKSANGGAGGTGATGNSSVHPGGAGGGGAGGVCGVGGNGGNANTATLKGGGGGGGGNGGANGAIATAANGATGGAGFLVRGNGAISSATTQGGANVAGTANTGGGGGGGFSNGTASRCGPGGAGGSGDLSLSLDATGYCGSGGGGGGGGGVSSATAANSAGGAGGIYGGGGGSGGMNQGVANGSAGIIGGAGADSIIVINYFVSASSRRRLIICS